MHAGKEALMERERAGGGYTVHELAELSGCTVRTLHHYSSNMSPSTATVRPSA